MSVVSGKQPLTQHQQNKGVDHGLQETIEGARPSPHRRDRSGQGGKLQVPRRTHHRQSWLQPQGAEVEGHQTVK